MKFYTLFTPLSLAITAKFSSLFNFPDDLLEGQSELSSPPDSSDDEHSDEYTEDEEDEWYNLPFDPSDNEDDSVTPSFTLFIRPAASFALIVSTASRKEHSTGVRIKAIYMLEERKSLSQIQIFTKVIKSNVYCLMTAAKERR